MISLSIAMGLLLITAKQIKIEQAKYKKSRKSRTRINSARRS